MDITEKAAKQASKGPGPTKPANEPNVKGMNPVLDNRWGAGLSKGQKSLSLK